MPLPPILDFQRAHAEARDAVHAALDTEALVQALAPRRALTVRSEAADRAIYLRRPDLGRRLAAESRAMLEAEPWPQCDCVFVVADGLSATAVERHAAALLGHTLPRLAAPAMAPIAVAPIAKAPIAMAPIAVAPIVVATQARVALGDAVGEAMRARLCAVLIGERPGLSVADSLGVYLTYDPRPGRRDCERNCISNIHGRGGLSYPVAADKLVWLIEQALSRRLTGVALKEGEARPALDLR